MPVSLILAGITKVWKDEDEIPHRKKWGIGIKQSPLLQGYDNKLWREENNHGLYDPNGCGFMILSQGNEYFDMYDYYCMLMYFDKYGRYADLAIASKDEKWRVWEHAYPDICNGGDLEEVINWWSNGNDSIFLPYNGLTSVSCIHKDTLQVRNLKTGKETHYIAINLPPKSKWEEVKKR
jgi:hypothetical protein